MGINCEDLGFLMIQTRSGNKRKLSHDDTVRICKEAQEKGASMEEIVKKSVEPDLKVMRILL